DPKPVRRAVAQGFSKRAHELAILVELHERQGVCFVLSQLRPGTAENKQVFLRIQYDAAQSAKHHSCGQRKRIRYRLDAEIRLFNRLIKLTSAAGCRSLLS